MLEKMKLRAQLRDDEVPTSDHGNQLSEGQDGTPLEMKRGSSKPKFDHKVSKETFGGVTEEASAARIGIISPALLSRQNIRAPLTRGSSKVSQIQKESEISEERRMSKL